MRSTLDPNVIIPDAVAKRLAARFGLDALAATGAIHADDAATLAAREVPADCKDQHGWYADKRALGAYIAASGERTMVRDWERLTPSLDTVPWSYGRAS